MSALVVYTAEVCRIALLARMELFQVKEVLWTLLVLPVDLAGILSVLYIQMY